MDFQKRDLKIQAIQIPTARLDLDTSPDMDSSGDELLYSHQSVPCRHISPKKDAVKPDAKEPASMPPELIVTSSQPQDNVFERLYRPSDPLKGTLTISKPTSRRNSCKKSPEFRARRKLVRQNGEQSDPEYRPEEVSLPIKKHFWKALSNDNIPWSYNYNEHEDLLKACSEKLSELKKKHRSRGKDRLDLDLIGAPSKILPAKRRIKRRAKSMRVERTLMISNEAQLQIESFKLKPTKPDYKKLDEEATRRQNGKKNVPNRKFRKGGIVSLATVNPNILPGKLQQQGSGDESTEAIGTKKKKKKRKILQITKTVKSAMSAVTAVSVTRKDGSKGVSKKKF